MSDRGLVAKPSIVRTFDEANDELTTLPVFPDLVPLELRHLPAIRTFTDRFDSYSDFNAVSLWCWSAAGDFRVAQLNGSLVVEFGDYLTGERYLSLLGDRQLDDSVTRLLEYAHDRPELSDDLRLVPACVVEALAGTTSNGPLVMEPDRDAADYLIDVTAILSCAGPRYANIRQHLHRFQRDAGERSRFLSVDSDWLAEHRAELIQIFDTWTRSGRDGAAYSQAERLAVLRFIAHSATLRDNFDIAIGVAHIDDRIVGYHCSEVVSNGVGIGHFVKGDPAVPGITTVLMLESWRLLQSHGVKFFNNEQDLGIPGLRTAKLLMRPSGFLTKYVIRSATDSSSQRHTGLA